LEVVEEVDQEVELEVVEQAVEGMVEEVVEKLQLVGLVELMDQVVEEVVVGELVV